MTNSTSESAPRTNKRRRSNNDNSSVHHAQNPQRTPRQTIDTAKDSTDPHQLLGTRLEPIMEVLEAQPEIFQTHIIKSSNLMLDRIAHIKQRRTNSAVFQKPIVDPKHGIGTTTDDDAPLMFVPTSTRKKCPIEPSNEFQDHPRMKDRLRLANLDHDA